MTTMQTTMQTSTETLGSLFFTGAATELDYLTTDEQAAARALESELLADAAAGVDIRIRLIGVAVSQ